jgi:hypothetical protein
MYVIGRSKIENGNSDWKVISSGPISTLIEGVGNGMTMARESATLTEQSTYREIGIGLALTVGLLFGVLLVQVATREDRRYDFSALYTAGWIVRQGQGARLYDLGEQAEAEERVLERKGLLPIIHPPFEALAFAPLSLFPYSIAYLTWGAMNIVLWMWFAYIVRPYVPVPKQTFRYLVLCFAFFPAWIALCQGQTSFLLLLLFTLVFMSLKRERDFRAGILLALGLLRFQIVLPFALILLLLRKWRAMAGFSLTAGVLATVSVMVVGIAGIRSYIFLMLYLAKHATDPLFSVITPRGMPTARGFFGTLLHGRLPSAWSSIFIAMLCLSLILLACWQWRRSRSLERAFSCALLGSILASYHVYPHDLLLLLLPVLLMAGELRHTIARAAVIILYLPVYPIMVYFDSLYWLFLVIAVFAASLFGLGKNDAGTLNAVLEERPGAERIIRS